MRENLAAGAEDARLRAAEKEQRLQKNASEALDRQKRFTQGRIASLEKQCESLQGHIDDLAEQKRSLSAELDKVRRAEKQALDRYNEAVNSSIYLAGRVVTWLPRKAVTLVRKLLSKNGS